MRANSFRHQDRERAFRCSSIRPHFVWRAPAELSRLVDDRARDQLCGVELKRETFEPGFLTAGQAIKLCPPKRSIENCEPDDFEGLLDELWRLYGDCIMAGEFSIDDYVWHSFTPDEIRTITQLLHDAAPTEAPET